MELKARFKTIWSRVFALVAITWLIVVLVFAVKEYQKSFNHYNAIPQAVSKYYNPYYGFHKICLARSSADEYANWLWAAFAFYNQHKDKEGYTENSTWYAGQIAKLDGLLGIKATEKFNIDISEIAENPIKYKDDRSLPGFETVWLKNIIGKLDLKEIYYHGDDSDCDAVAGRWDWVRYTGKNEARPLISSHIAYEIMERISPFLFLFIIPLLFIYISQIWISKGFSSSEKPQDKLNAEATGSNLKDNAPKLKGSSTDNTKKGRVGDAGLDVEGARGSAADELLKWAKLKEDGHISEEEFQEARDKLLKKH